MKLTKPEVQTNASVAEPKGDSAKLLSLLALATGAVAMPQTSNADIIFTDLSANPVHVGPSAGANGSYVINNFPGTAQIGFHTHKRATNNTSQRSITGRQEGGYVRLQTLASFVLPVNAGQQWNPAGHAASHPFVALGNFTTGFPSSFPDKYFLFEFKDSTQPGSPLRFGWIEVSLAVAAGNTNQPDLAIEGYAYDTTGALLASGQVPEPSAPALLALGAMALGAKGLRSWRKNRQTKS
jgi:hypothetical protein